MSTNIYCRLHQILKQGLDAVLIRIVRRRGSAPRGVGSCCIVDGNGLLHGSIGGGLLEHRAVARAMVLLQERVTSSTAIEMTADEIAAEGMICGGRVDLYHEPILAEDSTAVEFFARVADLVANGGRGTLVTLISDGVAAAGPGHRMLIDNAGEVSGSVPGADRIIGVGKPHLVETAGERYLFVEPLQGEPQLLLFGGGHIGTFVASLAAMAGFRVSVFDDRSEFANRERFPTAAAIYAMPYAEALTTIDITGAGYIVIVTRGHMGDLDVLELVLRSRIAPAYIGMIGSVNKRNIIFRELQLRGVREGTLSAIYAPIGLAIGAQTPEEIAVSIVAELIQVRAGRGKTSAGPETTVSLRKKLPWPLPN